MKILVTGGAGFVGFNLLNYLNDKYPNFHLIAFDNLKRLGSETNVAALNKRGIKFIHGDIRIQSELKGTGAIDVIIHCASDASVLSGITSSAESIIQNNLFGSINVFEHAVQCNAKLIHFSTNRIYSCQLLNEVEYSVNDTRFSLSSNQTIPGVTVDGITEEFPLHLSKTFYGATKYCSEILLQEYAAYKGLKYVINRFGVISGKGQFGVQDQGVISYWLKQHVRQGQLTYFGYGGEGKQVRDALHINDLCHLIDLQLKNFDSINGETFNAGGGKTNSFSLRELTRYCQEITGFAVPIKSTSENREGDIPIYYTNNQKVSDYLPWVPQYSIQDILIDLNNWYQENSNKSHLYRS